MKVFEDSKKNALQYAFRLLGYRDRSEKEVREKLAGKGFSEGVAEEALAYMKDQGFIDDKRVAGVFRRSVVEYRHLGRNGVRAYLIKKGIDADIAEEAAGNEDEYLDAAKKLIQKKLKNMKGCDSETVKRRLWGLLARRGFSGNTIYDLLKSYDLKEE